MDENLTLEDVQEPFIIYVEELLDKLMIKNALEDENKLD